MPAMADNYVRLEGLPPKAIVLRGIFVAILLSLGEFVRRAWRPHRQRRLLPPPGPVPGRRGHPSIRWVVVAVEPITDIDITAADTLRQLSEELRQEHVTLAFAEMKGPAKDRLERYGLFEAIGPDRSFPTIGTARRCLPRRHQRHLGSTGRAPGRSARPPLDRGGSERLEQPQQLEPP
jgi:hypothetical protein